jgi:hypothetical protein
MRIDLERSYVHERKRPKTNPPTSRERNEQHKQYKEKTDQFEKQRK